MARKPKTTSPIVGDNALMAHTLDNHSLLGRTIEHNSCMVLFATYGKIRSDLHYQTLELVASSANIELLMLNTVANAGLKQRVTALRMRHIGGTT